LQRVPVGLLQIDIPRTLPNFIAGAKAYYKFMSGLGTMRRRRIALAESVEIHSRGLSAKNAVRPGCIYGRRQGCGLIRRRAASNTRPARSYSWTAIYTWDSVQAWPFSSRLRFQLDELIGIEWHLSRHEPLMTNRRNGLSFAGFLATTTASAIYHAYLYQGRLPILGVMQLDAVFLI